MDAQIYIQAQSKGPAISEKIVKLVKLLLRESFLELFLELLKPLYSHFIYNIFGQLCP